MLSIRNAEVESLARELAARCGVGITEVILQALRERKDVLNDTQAKKKAQLDAIVERCRQLPVLDHRTPDEIMGYNEIGAFD
ncbi:MAG: type II toxin-antitoxin system VapB family antitoxin [Spirochaetales bacterium]